MPCATSQCLWIATCPTLNARTALTGAEGSSVQPLLRQCAQTINPISGNRGSRMKVATSPAAGRVCVSTREGARGYLDLGLPSLVTRERVREFAAPLRRLLDEVEYRRGLELLDEGQRYPLG